MTRDELKRKELFRFTNSELLEIKKQSAGSVFYIEGKTYTAHGLLPKLLDHIDRLERERDDYINRAITLTKMWDKKVNEFKALQKQADAGRELRKAMVYGWDGGDVAWSCDWQSVLKYDTDTKETGQ